MQRLSKETVESAPYEVLDIFSQFGKSISDNESVEGMPDWSKPESFGEPILFGAVETPEIDSGFLPSWVKGFVDALSASTQTPPGMSVMLALSVLAACNQKRFVVGPYGADDSYTEPLSLWTVTALPPASRKTKVLDMLRSPITAWERDSATRLKPEIERVNDRREIVEQRIADLKRQASKCNGEDGKTQENYEKEIQDLRAELPAPITAPQIYVTDTTPEGCRNFLVDHDGRCAILTDEAGFFEIAAGLYSNGRANLDVFLQMHAGGPLRVNRGKDTFNLPDIAGSVGLAIQPEPLADLGSGDKKRFRGTGLLARFLYCLPKSNIGSRDVSKRAPIPDHVWIAYKQGIKSLLDIEPRINEHRIEEPRILTLAPDAFNAWLRFAQWVENQQGAGGKFERIQDFTGKLHGAALRIAGNCHVAENGEYVTVIGSQTIEPVLDLCEKLIAHAQAAFEIMGDDPAISDARAAYRWIVDNVSRDEQDDCRKGAWYIRQNALYQTGRFKNSKVERLIKALDVLRERNVLSSQNRRQTKGRPELIWYVHPDALISGGGGNELA